MGRVIRMDLKERRVSKDLARDRLHVVSLAAATCVACNAFLPREWLLTQVEHSFHIVATGQSNSCYCVSRNNENVLNLTSCQISWGNSVQDKMESYLEKIDFVLVKC